MEHPVTGMRHVHLKVRDVERAARFYEEALGLQRSFSKDDGAMLFLTTPEGDLLTLSDAKLGGDVDRSGDHVGENGGIDHFGFTLAGHDQLEAVIERVLAAGGQLIRRLDIVPGLPSAFLRDIDGYAFQL